MPGVLAITVNGGAFGFGDTCSPAATAWHSAQTRCA
jgi:hypothetical protein